MDKRISIVWFKSFNSYISKYIKKIKTFFVFVGFLFKLTMYVLTYNRTKKLQWKVYSEGSIHIICIHSLETLDF